MHLENAFSAGIADECRAILWKATHCDPENPDTWTQPVIRIGEIGLGPFKKAANTIILHNAFDQLAGKANWLPKETLGSFPIRFPSKELSTDTGWHVDANFPGEDAGNYLEWRININSKGRALLMLFLFSDVSERDGPTIIRVGSHKVKFYYRENENGKILFKKYQLNDIIGGETKPCAGSFLVERDTIYALIPTLICIVVEYQDKYLKERRSVEFREFNPTNKRYYIVPSGEETTIKTLMQNRFKVQKEKMPDLTIK